MIALVRSMACRMLVLAVLAGCGGTPPAVRLSSEWPDTAQPYGEARGAWTRHGRATRHMTMTIDAYATLKSAAFRAAFVDEAARRFRLPGDERAKLAEKERAAAAEVWEVELIVATQHFGWNDFGKGSRSMWRVALAGDDGREVLPTSIKEDPRPKAELEIFYPGLDGFHRAYVVTFPRLAPDGKPLVGEGASRVALKVSGAQGAIELVWRGE